MTGRRLNYWAIGLLSAITLLIVQGIGPACAPDSVGGDLSVGDSRRIDSYQIITGDDEEAEREQWNKIFRTQAFVFGEQPVAFVKQSLPLLNRRGKALVLAMEEGRNAVFLARNGFEVTGIDFSDEAIRKAKRLAKKHGVQLQTINADLAHYKIEPETYDVIVSINFYREQLIHEIRKGLKRGGYVIWQSHTSEIRGASNRALRLDHLIKPGQLAKYFSDYTLLVSSETYDGQQGLASLVARKP